MLRPISTVSSTSIQDSIINKGDLPKVRPQVHNLPSAQPNQHAHCAECKPFDPLIRALICIAQLLLSQPQILHLLHNFIDRLFNTPQLCLNWFKLLRCLNSRPIACVSANVDVQLNVTAWIPAYFCIEGISIAELRRVKVIELGLLRESWGGTGGVRRPDSVFSKQTSKAVSARLVKAILVSPATSLGRP